MDQATCSPPPTVDDQEILKNINGRLHGPMPKFMQKFFPHIRNPQEDASDKDYRKLEVHGEGHKFTGWSSGSNFTTWFSDHVANQAGDASSFWHVSSNAADGENVDDSVRLILPSHLLAADRHMRWDNVQVIGQFCTSNIGYKDGLLRLCRSAHSLLVSQPTRLFVHGFYIRHLTLELWMFDRSGLYCNEPLNIQEDLARFKSVLLAYQSMTRLDLGYLEILRTDEHGSYISLESASTESSPRVLYIQTPPIASRVILVGSGTICYRARAPESTSWTRAIKFKWRWTRDRPENELLMKVKRHRVTGTLAVDYYAELETTASLRAGLRWGKHRRFLELPDSTEASKEEGVYATEGLAKYTEETNDFFQNRVLACIVTSPLGRPLQTFRSLKELLQVCCDALECHRELFQKANILHQDVSAGNILIVDDKTAGKRRGILIDLDSAIELDNGEEREPGITGTRPFMAIGVLKREVHTYRHDIESLFYVFLWTVITNHAESPPPTSRLARWSDGNWDELAARKLYDISREGFEDLLNEFTPGFECLKPLARDMRQLLFPVRHGRLYTGTDVASEAVDELYGSMIGVFKTHADQLTEK